MGKIWVSIVDKICNPNCRGRKRYEHSILINKDLIYKDQKKQNFKIFLFRGVGGGVFFDWGP